MQPAAVSSWVARWSGMLAVAAQRAYAATLLELPPAAELGEGCLICMRSSPMRAVTKAAASSAP